MARYYRGLVLRCTARNVSSVFAISHVEELLTVWWGRSIRSAAFIEPFKALPVRARALLVNSDARRRRLIKITAQSPLINFSEEVLCKDFPTVYFRLEMARLSR